MHAWTSEMSRSDSLFDNIVNKTFAGIQEKITIYKIGVWLICTGHRYSQPIWPIFLLIKFGTVLLFVKLCTDRYSQPIWPIFLLIKFGTVQLFVELCTE